MQNPPNLENSLFNKFNPSINLKPLQEKRTEDEILKKLGDLLDSLDDEKPPKEMEIDDYKDYLIWKLCKKVKFLMKKKNEENTPSDNRVEKESSMNKIFNKDVINIHQRIEKSLSNIEFQLEFNEEGRDVKNENKENFQEDLKNKNNVHQRIEKSLSNIEYQVEFKEEGHEVKNENNENIQEDLKNKNNENFKEKIKKIRMISNIIDNNIKNEEKNSQSELNIKNLKEKNSNFSKEPINENHLENQVMETNLENFIENNKLPENQVMVTNPENYIKNNENFKEKMKNIRMISNIIDTNINNEEKNSQSELNIKNLKEKNNNFSKEPINEKHLENQEMETNLENFIENNKLPENQAIETNPENYINKNNVLSNYNKIDHGINKLESRNENGINRIDCGIQTGDDNNYQEPIPNVKYPTDVLMSSLEKVKTHQIYYEMFSKENENLLKGINAGGWTKTKISNIDKNSLNLLNENGDHKDFNDLTMIKREKSPQSYAMGTPQSVNLNEEFLEEISILMKTNKKQDILGKIRSIGYLEKIESRYLEIIEIIATSFPENKINSHLVKNLIEFNDFLEFF